MSFFFFQAEDGIRDTSVTGVQTCALPIYQRAAPHARTGQHKDVVQRRDLLDTQPTESRRPEELAQVPRRLRRAEERRVGKECRWRWSRDDEKEKGNGVRERGHVTSE